MTTVSETIPEALQPEVDAALGWWNGEQDTPFEVTGILDPEATIASRGPRDGRVLYRWRSVPSRKNVGGAVARPTAEHVWTSIECALDEAPGAADVALDADPPLDRANIPWPLFASLLIANGWFVEPRAFEQRQTGPSVPRRIAVAFARLFGFAAFWTLGFALLPALPVASAPWAPWIVPKVRWLNREFQSVEERPNSS